MLYRNERGNIQKRKRRKRDQNREPQANRKRLYLQNPDTPLLSPHPLLPPLTIRRTVWLISRANTSPNTILRAMISRTGRRGRQLHSLKLRIRDNPHSIKIPHKLKIRPTPSKRLAKTVVVRSDVVEHTIPCRGEVPQRGSNSVIDRADRLAVLKNRR